MPIPILFATLDVATGHVTGRCYARHRHREFLKFLQGVAMAYPRGHLHLVLDNYRTHNQPDVQAWLSKHPRIHLHFPPASASWMNQVETWFSIIHRLKRPFPPLHLRETADEILAHAKRKAISGEVH